MGDREMEKKKVIIDCDTGHDDAIAIMLAAGSEAIDLIGITCVAGNAGLEHTLPNTLSVCQHLGLDIPVYGGCSGPLVREQIIAGDVHGKSGLDGPVFAPLVYKAQPENAVNFLVDTFMASDGDIYLCPVGPLTNVAMAMRLQPEIKKKIKRIVLMGGAVGAGNASPAAEFNILADPEAAHIVFTSGVPITMMGLDLTNQALATQEIIDRMRAIGNKAGNLFGDIMSFTLKSQAVNGLSAGPVHDVTTVAWLIDPSIFITKDMFVEVDISHGSSYGRTNCDQNNRLGKKPNATVGLGLDLERFWNLVEGALRYLN
jgi:ribosylpyrimidine nucleosidase